jgi:hypothetical protein
MEFLGEWVIRDSHLVNEYRSETGATWIELFPYVFCDSIQLTLDAADAAIHVLDPSKERFVLVAEGVASEYRASVPLFKRAVERVIEFLPNNDLSSYKSDFDQLNVLKVVANLLLGNSHDIVGSRWIDRFDWTDQIAPQIISENRNAMVRIDAARNVEVLRELNWMVAVMTSRRGKLYRDLTEVDFENWDVFHEIVRWSREFVDDEPDRIYEFYRVGCDNTFVRDIALAHLTFENTVDPNPLHIANPGEDETGENRSEVHGHLMELLIRDRFPDSWATNPIAPLDGYREQIAWLSDFAPYKFREIAEGRSDITAASRCINELTYKDADKLSDRQWEDASLILAFRKLFPYLFVNHKIDSSWSVLEIEDDDYADWAMWVHDEVAYTHYGTEFYITGTQHPDPMDCFERILRTRNVAAAARAMPILGYMYLSELHNFQTNEPNIYPRNGFSEFWFALKGFYGVYHDRFPNDWK